MSSELGGYHRWDPKGGDIELLQRVRAVLEPTAVLGACPAGIERIAR